MQNTVGAIRVSRSGTRFVTPVSRRQLPRLGLVRRAYAPSPGAPRAVRPPLAELRSAARSLIIAPMLAHAGVTPGLRPRNVERRMRWSRRVDDGIRRARPRSPAPWRA